MEIIKALALYAGLAYGMVAIIIFVIGLIIMFFDNGDDYNKSWLDPLAILILAVFWFPIFFIRRNKRKEK